MNVSEFDLEDALKEYYKDCSVTQNDGYYRVETNTATMYYSIDIDSSNVTLWENIPGDGGGAKGSSSYDYVTAVLDDHSADVICIEKRWDSGDSSANAITDALEFVHTNDMQVGNVCIEGFSHGCSRTLPITNGFLRSYKDLYGTTFDNSLAVLAVDPAGTMQGKNSKTYSRIADNDNVHIYMLMSDNANSKYYGASRDSYDRVKDAYGSQVTILTTDEYGHGDISKYSIKNHLGLFLAGIVGKVGDHSKHGKDKKANYKIKQDGEWISFKNSKLFNRLLHLFTNNRTILNDSDDDLSSALGADNESYRTITNDEQVVNMAMDNITLCTNRLSSYLQIGGSDPTGVIAFANSKLSAINSLTDDFVQKANEEAAATRTYSKALTGTDNDIAGQI